MKKPDDTEISAKTDVRQFHKEFILARITVVNPTAEKSVVIMKTRHKILNSCIKCSPVFKSFKTIRLNPKYNPKRFRMYLGRLRLLD